MFPRNAFSSKHENLDLLLLLSPILIGKNLWLKCLKNQHRFSLSNRSLKNADYISENRH